MKKKENEEFHRERLRMELHLVLNQTIRNFKSREEPKLKIKKQDIQITLAGMLLKRL